MAIHPKDTSVPPPAPESTGRREFLGRSAAMAAAAVGGPALLAACGQDAAAPTEAQAPVAAPTGGPALALECDNHVSPQPWWALHYTLAGTIGASASVKVPTLESGKYGYVQRIITDDSRIGTALATVLRRDYKWSNGSATVHVQGSGGRGWSARSIYSQEDLAYAMKDALAGNALAYGVLRDSLEKGKPIITLFKSSAIQYADSVASDYWGNRIKPAQCAFSGIFNTAVSDIPIHSTVRDFSMC